MPARTRLWTLALFSSVLLGPACGREPQRQEEPKAEEVWRPHADWPAMKAWVRTDFPDVEFLTVDELRAEQGLRDPLLIDARAEEEFVVSHLPGAHHAADVQTALEVVQREGVNRPVVVYCSIGYRSGRLATQLQEAGVKPVFNLEGSIFEWANAGYPVEREGVTVEEVHPFDDEWGRLLRRELWATGR